MKQRAITAVAVIMLLGATTVAEAARCITKIAFYNVDRTVPGPVNVECGGISQDYMHSAPFGNWGVDSNYGSAHDGYQFSGWYPDDGWRQWNSCTSTYRSPEHLPEEPQLAKPNYGNLYARATRYHRPGRPCNVIHRSGAYVLSGLYMRLYELDTKWDFLILGNGSDYVTTLYFPTLVTPISCNSTGYCRGQSAYKQNRFANRPATAKIAVVITTDYR